MEPSEVALKVEAREIPETRFAEEGIPSSLVLDDLELLSELLSATDSIPCISRKFLLFLDMTKVLSRSLDTPFKPASLRILERRKFEYSDTESDSELN